MEMITGFLEIVCEHAVQQNWALFSRVIRNDKHVLHCSITCQIAAKYSIA